MTNLLATAMELSLDDGTTLALLVASADGSRGLIVCIPDLMGSKEDLSPLLPWLAKAGYTAVALDLRGQYQSTSPHPTTISELVSDIEAVVDAFRPDPDADAHLVGIGFGGLVAIETACADSQAWSSLTLVNAGTSGVPNHETLCVLADGLEAGDSLDQVYQNYRQTVPASGSEAKEAFDRRRFLAYSRPALVELVRLCRCMPDRMAQLNDTDLNILFIAPNHAATDEHHNLGDVAHRLGATFVTVDGDGTSIVSTHSETVARAITRQCSCLH